MYENRPQLSRVSEKPHVHNNGDNTQFVAADVSVGAVSEASTWASCRDPRKNEIALVVA